jgi:hypothetical protein
MKEERYSLIDATSFARSRNSKHETVETKQTLKDAKAGIDS